jgi:predicted secreted hydrolase
MGDKTNGVDLHFVQKKRSWKGKTLLGNWLVIPLFDVTGSIFIDGKKVDISGVGYHDHNIYPLYAPFFLKGYHFGKIPLDKFDITWAKVMSRIGADQPIVVINKDDSYISIDPSNIQFNIEKKIKKNKKIIPEIFNINVDNDYVNLSVKCIMDSVHNIHIPSLNYWRYHIHYLGEMTIDSKTINIDLIDISELLRFF